MILTVLDSGVSIPYSQSTLASADSDYMTGQIVMAVNMLIHGINQTVSEALTLAEANGIEISDAYDVIEESAAVCPMLRFRRPIYLDETSHEVTFALSLARKDMGLVLELGESTGVSMPQSQLPFDVLQQAGPRVLVSVIWHQSLTI